MANASLDLLFLLAPVKGIRNPDEISLGSLSSGEECQELPTGGVVTW